MEDTMAKSVPKDIKQVNRGEVWLISMKNESVSGSEQGGYYRPCVILQNDIGNKYSPTTIVAMITSQTKNAIPTHMDISLKKDSTIMFEQINTVSKDRLIKRVSLLDEEQIFEANDRIKISLGIY